MAARTSGFTVLLLLVTSGKYTFAQVNLVSLRATKATFQGSEWTNSSVSCTCTPANADYNFVRWRLSENGNLSTSERVYQYSSGGGTSYGKLQGRANHSHDKATGVLTLYINTYLNDLGTYYCDFRGTQELIAETYFDVISDARNRSTWLKKDIPSIVQKGKSYNATVRHEANRPPVNFSWTRIENNTIVDVQNETMEGPQVGPLLTESSSTYFIPDVKYEFSLILRKFHPSYGWEDDSTIQVTFTACSSQPCLNGGTCVDLQDGRNYRCSCTDKYTGNQCEIADAIKCWVCVSNQAQRNTSCETGGTEKTKRYGENVSSCTLCMKTLIQHKNNTINRLERGCYPFPKDRVLGPVPGCTRTNLNKGHTYTCFCDKDDCNLAAVSTVNKALSLICMILAFLKQYL